MSFAGYLKSYLTNNELNIAQASRIIGIDRATLYRYTTGERKPKSIDAVEDIADRLCMSANEKEEIIEEFDKQTFGDELVNSYHYVRSLIDTMSNANAFCRKRYIKNPTETGSVCSYVETSSELNSPQAIISCAMLMLQNEAISGHTDSSVKLLMQPSYSKIQEMLTPIFINSDTMIEQIVCFEKTIEKGYINLNLLEEIITPAFCLKNYDIYYHYDILQSHISTASLMPNLIISDKCVLLFDYEMQSGYFTQDTEMVRYLEKKFASLKRKCSPLLEKGSYADIVGEMNLIVAGERIGSIFNQPCISPCLDEEMLEKSIINLPLKQPLIESLIKQNGTWNDMEHTPGELNVSNIISCCTESGIINMLKTGRIGEFPDQYYIPMTKEFKIRIVKRMILLSQAGMFSYIILKKNVGLSDTMQCYWTPDARTVSFRHITQDSLTQIIIKETSIYNSILSFIDYIAKKGLAYSREESVEYLQSLLDKLINNEL